MMRINAMSPRLFHVSEESAITKFEPRIPTREDLDKSKGLVWAITEDCLPNFLTPRNCPRVTYHAGEQTLQADIERFFSSASRHCVVIENAWFKRMLSTTLYIYEFKPDNFYLQDKTAGYYVSEKTEIPISVRKAENIFQELFERNVEVRMLDNLWKFGREVQKSTLNWSLCKMSNAEGRQS